MTSDNIIKGLHYLIDWINAIPGKEWYALGITLASIPAVIGIIAWIKARHYKLKAEELANHFVYINLIFWSTVMTVADWVLTNGHSFATFLPYLNAHWTQIAFYSSATYTFAKAAKGFMDSRKQAKKPFANTLPDLQPLVEQVNTPVVTEPTASTEPPKNVFGIGG